MKRVTLLSLVWAVCLVAPGFAQQQEEERSQTPRFQREFSVPGVEFTEQQQARVEELRGKYAPQLVEMQRRQSRVATPEQRRARREAVQAARDAGKPVAEQRAAGNAAFEYTEEQQQQLQKIRQERSELVAQIQRELRALLTAEQREAVERSAPRQRRARRIRPTHADVSYGPHDRNVMDVWLAETDSPAPVLVSIHGGGFRGGNKSVAPDLLAECLGAGISVVAITYRLSDEAIAPAQHHDAARAIQFIRHQAKEWNLDPQRIAATGSSAGAGLSMWLGFHPDLADPENEDPVLRQSTRLSCMAVYNGQSSYDPRFIRDLFPGTDTYLHPALPQFFGADLAMLDELAEEKHKLFEYVSAINFVSEGDPPVLLAYGSQMDTPIRTQGIGIHHPKFAQALKEKADPLGVECRIETGIRRGNEEWTNLTMSFIKEHLGVE
jgi:acetyl esterase